MECLNPLSLRERVAESARPGEGVSWKYLANESMSITDALTLTLSLRERVAESARPGEGVSWKYLANESMSITDALTLTLSRRERGLNKACRSPRNFANCSQALGVMTDHLLDEQHFAVLGQRPNVISDDVFQGIGSLAHAQHRGHHFITEVLGVMQHITFALVCHRMFEFVDG